MNRSITSASIAPPAANYAHAVLTTTATRWLHTSGVVPPAADGTVPATIEDQAKAVWSNIGAMLDETFNTVAVSVVVNRKKIAEFEGEDLTRQNRRQVDLSI